MSSDMAFPACSDNCYCYFMISTWAQIRYCSWIYGWPTQKPSVELTLEMKSLPRCRKVNETIISQWCDIMKIRIVLNFLEAFTLIAKITELVTSWLSWLVKNIRSRPFYNLFMTFLWSDQWALSSWEQDRASIPGGVCSEACFLDPFQDQNYFPLLNILLTTCQTWLLHFKIFSLLVWDHRFTIKVTSLLKTLVSINFTLWEVESASQYQTDHR